MTTTPTQADHSALVVWLRAEADRHMASIAWKDPAVNAHVLQLREWADALAASEARNVPEGCTPADAKMLRAANHGLADENAALREALQFYADGSHFVINEPQMWDTASGEPQNYLFDEANSAQIEDGSIARATLAKYSPVPVEIESVQEYFDDSSAPEMLDEMGRAAAILANEGLIPRPDLERDPLWQWRCIANEAEIVVNPKGKFLMLSEEMCVRLGGALEAAEPAPVASKEAVTLEPIRWIPSYIADELRAGRGISIIGAALQRDLEFDTPIYLAQRDASKAEGQS